VANGGTRPDHVAALTEGHTLPLEPIDQRILAVILEGLVEAWDALLMKGYQALKSGTEAEVTALLVPKLNNFCQSRLLWKDVVQSAARGSEMVNFNGSKLEKRPDLPLTLRMRSGNFPLIAECKIIDRANGQTTKRYCDEGVARFVVGDYAWAEREGIMLAYVRDGKSIGSKLALHLQPQSGKTADPFLTLSGPELVPEIHPTAHNSTHNRSFQYLDVVDGTEPGPISLWHLWLPV
jgi:hypothetical protein